jgi:hypothetical protein
MHVLFREGYADRAYMERYTDCPAELTALLKSQPGKHARPPDTRFAQYDIAAALGAIIGSATLAWFPGHWLRLMVAAAALVSGLHALFSRERSAAGRKGYQAKAKQLHLTPPLYHTIPMPYQKSRETPRSALQDSLPTGNYPRNGRLGPAKRSG